MGKRMIVALSAIAIMFSSVFAETKVEAEAFVNDAVALCSSAGVEKCLDAFTNDAAWKKGELYIFALTYTGDVKAHGANAKLVGKNLQGAKDKNGKFFFQEFAKAAQAGGGWVEYLWPKPDSTGAVEKISFVKPINSDIYVGAGIYK